MSVSSLVAGNGKSVEFLPRVQSELDLIETALRDAGTDEVRWGQLYAAQQALCWAASEDLAAAPYTVITEGKVQPITGIPAD